MKPVPYSSRRKDHKKHDNEQYCLLCGKRCNGEWWVTLIGGGFLAERTDEIDENDPGYMGSYPVGPECVNKVKDCAWRNPSFYQMDTPA